MNSRALLDTFVSVLVIMAVCLSITILCGAALKPNPATYEVMRRCGPPMNITVTDDKTGESTRHFAIPVWYEYSTLLLDDEALRGFHFESQDGTVLID